MNSFGRLFRISIFGESHGKSIGVLIDGCPAGIALNMDDFERELARRRAGGVGTTPRVEADVPSFMSGVLNGITTGAPILITFENKNTKSGDYSHLRAHPRPGHADLTSTQKYGSFNDMAGGGHFSGRLTLGLVSAGVIARQIIAPMSISSKILEIGGSTTDFEKVLNKAIEDHDSVGGIIEVTGTNMAVGLGEHFFDSAESYISHMVFSVGATRSIEFGTGAAAARMLGSEHNDRIIDAQGKTATNHAGGINGGITNGNDLVFRVAVKPTSSIGVAQDTYNFNDNSVNELLIGGRHDVCIALRIPPVLEAVTAIALADLMLINKAYKNQ